VRTLRIPLLQQGYFNRFREETLKGRIKQLKKAGY